MTTKRLVVLLAVLLCMSAVRFLPKNYFQPVGVDLRLPESVGAWTGKDMEISKREVGILGEETEFARKSYTNGQGDMLHVTIVLSGHDMDKSIHRPERCLQAQGWSIMGSQTVPVPVPGRGGLDTRQLKVVIREQLEGGRQVLHTNLNYYWFVGSKDTTALHLQRWIIDKTDRLFRGYNQRWAYFTVAATITQGMQPNGRSEAETAAMIEDFIKGMVPPTHLPSVKFGS